MLMHGAVEQLVEGIGVGIAEPGDDTAHRRHTHPDEDVALPVLPGGRPEEPLQVGGVGRHRPFGERGPYLGCSHDESLRARTEPATGLPGRNIPA